MTKKDEKEKSYFLFQLEMDFLAALPDCEWRFGRAAKLMIKSVYHATKAPFDFWMHTRRWFKQGVTILAVGPLAHLPVSERDYNKCDFSIEESLRKLATELVSWRYAYYQRMGDEGGKKKEPEKFLNAIYDFLYKPGVRTRRTKRGMSSKHCPIDFFTEHGRTIGYNEYIFPRLAESCVKRDFDVRPPDDAIQEMADRLSYYFIPENDVSGCMDDLEHVFDEQFTELSLIESRIMRGEDPASILKDYTPKPQPTQETKETSPTPSEQQECRDLKREIDARIAAIVAAQERTLQKIRGNSNAAEVAALVKAYAIDSMDDLSEFIDTAITYGFHSDSDDYEDYDASDIGSNLQEMLKLRFPNDLNTINLCGHEIEAFMFMVDRRCDIYRGSLISGQAKKGLPEEILNVYECLTRDNSSVQKDIKAQLDSVVTELKAHVTAETDREIAAKAPKRKRKYGHEGNGKKGPKTTKMEKQLQAFVQFVKSNPIDGENTLNRRANQFWQQNRKAFKAAKNAAGDAKGYASFKSIAQAYS